MCAAFFFFFFKCDLQIEGITWNSSVKAILWEAELICSWFDLGTKMGIPSSVRNGFFLKWSSSKSTSLHWILTVGTTVVSTSAVWCSRVFAAKGDSEAPWCSILSLDGLLSGICWAGWRQKPGCSSRLRQGLVWSQSPLLLMVTRVVFAWSVSEQVLPGSYHACRKTSGEHKG